MKLRDMLQTIVNFGKVVEQLKSRDEMIERLIRREIKDIQWRLNMLENNPDERRRRNTVIEQGGLANPYRNGVPVSVDPAGKIGHSVAPTPERALNAAAVLADAIAKHDDKAPDVSPALEFYNAAGGYAWFRRNVTSERSCVKLGKRNDWKYKQWQLTFGAFVKGRSKCKSFDTRREAEQFAFAVLTIHESECIKRKSPTDWWSRVKIFEVIKR